jgi:predicted small secreted protein
LRQRTTPAADDPKEIQMKRLFALMLLAMFSVGSLSACNTVKGAGKDVQKVGEKVEGAADDTGATDPR